MMEFNRQYEVLNFFELIAKLYPSNFYVYCNVLIKIKIRSNFRKSV